MPDLLLEVLSEEIPARMQKDGALALANNILSRLQEALLTGSSKEAEYFYTPRRLVVRVRDLPTKQPNITVERKGPRVDAPEKAIQGFLKSTGLTLEDCEQRETPKGPVWFAVKREKGRPTTALLADLLPAALAAVSWPKSMRWEASGTRWVRPIRSILCLLDDAVVPFRFGTVESGRTTLGHRFLHSGSLKVDDAVSYEAVLKDAKVMLRPKERTNKITKDALELAECESLIFADDGQLVNENAGLVEWPMVLMGRIDERFMDLPPEVLRSAMSKHQRYFSLHDKDGRPVPRFVMVANTEAADGNDAIVTGNERVLRARLADARFFWDQDRRQRLADRVPQLEGVVFHARLGSMADKARRIERLARTLCRYIGGADPDEAARAGLLCKADLVTEMVGEFPDLQGTMGGYYARADGEAEAVCVAIAAHYAPQGPGDSCPKVPLSVAVALADKLDTLAGFFAIDERPTGSKDPFALRRAANGAISLIILNKVRLPLRRVLAEAVAGYGALLFGAEAGAARDSLLDFSIDRLEPHFRYWGVGHDLVNAVLGTRDEDDLVRLLARGIALARFLDTEDGANLLTAYRRASQYLASRGKEGRRAVQGPSRPQALRSRRGAHPPRACRRGQQAGRGRARA